MAQYISDTDKACCTHQDLCCQEHASALVPMPCEPQLIEDICSAVETHDKQHCFVLIGDPGIGKTYALARIREKLDAHGYEVRSIDLAEESGSKQAIVSLLQEGLAGYSRNKRVHGIVLLLDNMPYLDDAVAERVARLFRRAISRGVYLVITFTDENISLLDQLTHYQTYAAYDFLDTYVTGLDPLSPDYWLYERTHGIAALLCPLAGHEKDEVHAKVPPAYVQALYAMTQQLLELSGNALRRDIRTLMVLCGSESIDQMLGWLYPFRFESRKDMFELEERFSPYFGVCVQQDSFSIAATALDYAPQTLWSRLQHTCSLMHVSLTKMASHAMQHVIMPRLEALYRLNIAHLDLRKLCELFSEQLVNQGEIGFVYRVFKQSRHNGAYFDGDELELYKRLKSMQLDDLQSAGMNHYAREQERYVQQAWMAEAAQDTCVYTQAIDVAGRPIRTKNLLEESDHKGVIKALAAGETVSESTQPETLLTSTLEMYPTNLDELTELVELEPSRAYEARMRLLARKRALDQLARGNLERALELVLEETLGGSKDSLTAQLVRLDAQLIGCLLGDSLGDQIMPKVFAHTQLESHYHVRILMQKLIRGESFGEQGHLSDLVSKLRRCTNALVRLAADFIAGIQALSQGAHSHAYVLFKKTCHDADSVHFELLYNAAIVAMICAAKGQPSDETRRWIDAMTSTSWQQLARICWFVYEGAAAIRDSITQVHLAKDCMWMAALLLDIHEFDAADFTPFLEQEQLAGIEHYWKHTGRSIQQRFAHQQDVEKEDTKSSIPLPKEQSWFSSWHDPVPVTVRIMGPLQLEVLGHTYYARDLSSRKVGTLVTLLARSSNYCLPREQLRMKLFPHVDPIKAEQRLAQSISALRRILKRHGELSLVKINKKTGDVSLDADQLHVDLTEFDHIYEFDRGTEYRADLITCAYMTLDLYRGSLAVNSCIDDVEVHALTQRLRKQFIEIMVRGIEALYTMGYVRSAYTCARKVLKLCPACEPVLLLALDACRELGLYTEVQVIFDVFMKSWLKEYGSQTLPSRAVRERLASLHDKQLKQDSLKYDNVLGLAAAGTLAIEEAIERGRTCEDTVIGAI